MKKSKQLIFEDKKLIPQLNKDLEVFEPHLKRIKTNYEALEIGKFNNEVLDEVLSKGTADIKERFEAKIEAELKGVGLAASLIKEKLLEGSEAKITALREAVEAAKKARPVRFGVNSYPELTITSISFEKGEFCILKEEQEKLLDKYSRVYLSTPEEFELHESLQGFINAFENINDTLEKSGLSRIKDVNELTRAFFNNKDDEFSIKPRSLNWVLHELPKMKAARSAREEKRAQLNRKNQQEHLAHEAARMKNS